MDPFDVRERMRARQFQSNVSWGEYSGIQPLEFHRMVGSPLHPVDARERMRARLAQTQSSVRPQESLITSSDRSLEEFDSETRLESEGIQVEREIVEATKEEIRTVDSEENIISLRNEHKIKDNDTKDTYEVISLERTTIATKALDEEKRAIKVRQNLMTTRFELETKLRRQEVCDKMGQAALAYETKMQEDLEDYIEDKLVGDQPQEIENESLEGTEVAPGMESALEDHLLKDSFVGRNVSHILIE